MSGEWRYRIRCFARLHVGRPAREEERSAKVRLASEIRETDPDVVDQLCKGEEVSQKDLCKSWRHVTHHGRRELQLFPVDRLEGGRDTQVEDDVLREVVKGESAVRLLCFYSSPSKLTIGSCATRRWSTPVLLLGPTAEASIVHAFLPSVTQVM